MLASAVYHSQVKATHRRSSAILITRSLVATLQQKVDQVQEKMNSFLLRAVYGGIFRLSAQKHMSGNLAGFSA